MTRSCDAQRLPDTLQTSELSAELQPHLCSPGKVTSTSDMRSAQQSEQGACQHNEKLQGAMAC